MTGDVLEEMFQKPLPRRADGEVDLFECAFAEGPLAGKKLRDCTKEDIELQGHWAKFRERRTSGNE